MFSAETNTPVVPAGTWTHVSCTYTATGGKSEIYVNGVLKKQEFTGSGILSQVNILHNRKSPLKSDGNLVNMWRKCLMKRWLQNGLKNWK